MDAQETLKLDLVPFGRVGWWEGGSPKEVRFRPVSSVRLPGERIAWQPHAQADGWQLGVEWDEPRDIWSLECSLPEEVAPPRVEYWQRAWPATAPERLPGARHSWLPVDDHFNGRWLPANVSWWREGERAICTFDPLDITELREQASWPALVQSHWYGAVFRRTLKVRLVGQGQAPQSICLRVYSDAALAERELDVYFGCGGVGPGEFSGSVAATNGEVRLLGALPPRCGAGAGIRLAVRYAAGPGGEPLGRESCQRTIVTIYNGEASFSFLVADVKPAQPVFVPDLGVMVVAAGEEPDWQSLRRAANSRPCFYERVAEEPEQTVARAFAEIPVLDVTKQSPYGRYLPLGFEGNRQEFALRYNGNIVLDKRHLKCAGHDTARLLWPHLQIRYNFGTGDPPDFRERPGAAEQSLLEGYLPVVRTRWVDREIEYVQEAFACPLGPVPDGPSAVRGDEELVLLVRLTMRNATDGPKLARLWFNVWPAEELVLEGEKVLAAGRPVPDRPVKRGWRKERYAVPRLRAWFEPGPKGTACVSPCPEPSFLPPASESFGGLTGFGEPERASAATHSALLYELPLAEGESHFVLFKIPFSTFTGPQEWQRLAELSWESSLAAVCAYWRGYVSSGCELATPDEVVDDFFRAVRTHVAISVDRDPGSGLYIVPAATYTYGACGNEACLQIRHLDQCGYHDRAQMYLETFLATQGWRELDGNFRSAEGTLQALDIYDGEAIGRHFSYNLDHGFIMECLAEHYWLSGDRAWLERVAPKLIAACDFVIRERQATKELDGAGEPVAHYGLLPAGHLEDNPEWQYWFAVNAHAHGGMKAIAEALADIGHPEAQRLRQEAEAYRQDIRRAVWRARVHSPVVRLRDGTYIPHIPTRTGLQGRDYGWFREGAYGPLHLVDGGVLEPDEPEVTWILKDLEDNIFVTWAYGWATDLERGWFSCGGVAVQANLLNNGLVYLRRGQIKHAVRALLNNLGLNLYRDVRAFTEHPVVEPGHGVGPFYKTPDECGFLVSLRRYLVLEEGESLHLAKGLPACWLQNAPGVQLKRAATHFGTVSLAIRPSPEGDRLEADLSLQLRRQPARAILYLRHPAGKRMREVRIDGEPWEEWDPQAYAIGLPLGREQLRVVAVYEG